MKFALLIGINYNHTDYKLNGCINDVNNIKSLLNKFDKINVLTEENATKSNIINAFTLNISLLKPRDTFFVYYSGHGSQIKDRNGDEKDGLDEVMVPYDYLNNGTISDDWIFENVISKVNPLSKLIICMDCCHSGSIVDLKYKYSPQYKPIVTNPNRDYNPKEWTDSFQCVEENDKITQGNIILFSGCADNQQSRETMVNNIYVGVFSTCFLQTMKRSKKNTCLEVFKEINCRMYLLGFPSQQCNCSMNNIQVCQSIFDI